MVLLDKIPIKTNLRRLNAISKGVNADCVCRMSAEESTEHFLFVCSQTMQIWLRCFKWLGYVTALPRNSHVHLLQFELLGLNMKQNELLKVILLAVLWSVWNDRNNLMFREVEMEIERLFEMVQICSWNWITAGLQ